MVFSPVLINLVFADRLQIQYTSLVCSVFITRTFSRDKISLMQNISCLPSFSNTSLLLFVHFCFSSRSPRAEYVFWLRINVDKLVVGSGLSHGLNQHQYSGKQETLFTFVWFQCNIVPPVLFSPQWCVVIKISETEVEAYP